MSNVIYQIAGKEAEQLRAMREQVQKIQLVFLEIIGFIGQREGVALDQVEFNQKDLAFVTKEVPKE